MKLNVKAAAATSALIWSGSVLIVGVANLVRPQYGREFLQVVSSIYPGYKARRSVSQVAVGAAYAALDGAVGGAFCAWLYNRLASSCVASKCAATEESGESSRPGPVRTAV